MNPDTNLPVKWLYGINAGKDIICSGTWQSLSSVHIYGSALKKVHDNDESTQGVYIKQCSLCLLHPNFGCELHRGLPHIRSKGNVCNNIKFKGQQKAMGLFVVETYESRKTLPFFHENFD